MSSTAIPIAFPPQTIAEKSGTSREFPNGHFADGGTAGQFKRFEEHIGADVLANGPYETLHIISPMREEGEADFEKMKQGLHDQTLTQVAEERLKNFASRLSFGAFMKFVAALDEWQQKNGPIAQNVYVNIPRLPSNFGILDFNQEKKQYETVCQWIDDNPDQLAVPLADFLAQHSQSA